MSDYPIIPLHPVFAMAMNARDRRLSTVEAYKKRRTTPPMTQEEYDKLQTNLDPTGAIGCGLIDIQLRYIAIVKDHDDFKGKQHKPKILPKYHALMEKMKGEMRAWLGKHNIESCL